MATGSRNTGGRCNAQRSATTSTSWSPAAQAQTKRLTKSPVPYPTIVAPLAARVVISNSRTRGSELSTLHTKFAWNRSRRHTGRSAYRSYCTRAARRHEALLMVPADHRHGLPCTHLQRPREYTHAIKLSSV